MAAQGAANPTNGHTATLGSLCAGYGGLDLAVAEVLGAQPAWFAEIDPAASAILAHHWPDVPNYGDLTATDWTHVLPVDLVTFGWPCQPWSMAGKGLGKDDERAIWPAIAHAIGVLRPRLIVAENVPGIVVRGELARVLSDLAALGFDAEWTCVPASGVDAPHRRERIFLVATHPDRSGLQGEVRAQPAAVGRWVHERERVSEQPTAERGGAPAADPAGVGRGERRPQPARLVRGPDAALSGNAAAHTNRDGREGRPERNSGPHRPEQPAPLGADLDGRVLDWAGYEPAIRRWETVLGRRAPAPTVLGRRGGQQLSPRFVEWMQGLPAGWVTDVPGLTRNQQLKALGNGVVPQQAAAALRHLLPLLSDLEAAA